MPSCPTEDRHTSLPLCRLHPKTQFSLQGSRQRPKDMVAAAKPAIASTARINDGANPHARSMSTPETSPKPSNVTRVVVPAIDEYASEPRTYVPLETGMVISSLRLPVKRCATTLCPTSMPMEKVTPQTSVPARSRRTTSGSSGAIVLVT